MGTWDLPGIISHVHVELSQGRTVHLELVDRAWASGPSEALSSLPL